MLRSMVAFQTPIRGPRAESLGHLERPNRTTGESRPCNPDDFRRRMLRTANNNSNDGGDSAGNHHLDDALRDQTDPDARCNMHEPPLN